MWHCKFNSCLSLFAVAGHLVLTRAIYCWDTWTHIEVKFTVKDIKRSFMGFSIAGALMSIVLISIEIWFLNWRYYHRGNGCLGNFIAFCGSALMILLVVSNVFAFKRCIYLREKKNSQQGVFVNSSNAQSEKLVQETNIKQLVSQLSFGNQPVVIQIFPSAHVMVPGCNVMVPSANEMVPNADVNGDFYLEKVSDQPPQYKDQVP